MVLSSLHVGGLLVIVFLHWWFIWLLIRKQSAFVHVPTGPFYVILLPTMRGILHGFYTSVLSGHSTFSAAEHAASEACADDHSGLLGSHYNIILYDAVQDDTYIKGTP